MTQQEERDKKRPGTLGVIFAVFAGLLQLVVRGFAAWLTWAGARTTTRGKVVAYGAPLAAVVVVIILISAAVGGGGDESAQEVTDLAEPAARSIQRAGDGELGEPAEVEAEPTVETEPAEIAPTQVPPTPTETLVVPTFRIIEREDVSFPGAVRLSFRVVTEFPITKAQAQEVMDRVTEDASSATDVNAIGVFLYHFEEFSDSIFTLAMSEFAPYGDWGRANEVSSGDYSKHEMVYQFRGKLDDPQAAMALLPTAEELRLCLAYNTAADANPELFLDEDIIPIAAARTGVPEDAVWDATDRCLAWWFA